MKKVCFKCKIEKDAGFFHKYRKGKDGLHTYCKEGRKSELLNIISEKNKKSVPKICSQCGQLREIDEYFKVKSKKDGLDSKCKYCRKERVNRDKKRDKIIKKEKNVLVVGK